MSRRKQSNPKPFKRLSDDEDDETEMKSTEANKTENEVESENSTSEQTIHSKQTIKSEPTSPVETKETNGEDNPPVIFLNDVLLLKKMDKDEARQMGRSFLVCAAIPLPKGSSLGPFDAEIISLSSIRQGDMVLQAQDENGETSFLRVEDPNATWLTMLRPAPNDSVRNASVFYKGGQIWCEIVSELTVGTELLSSFTIQESTKSEPCSPDSTDYKEKDDEIDMDIKTEVASPPSLVPTSPVATGNVINHAALLYGCPFCGVRFSSARTLEGHLTYYCSKKPSNVNAENEVAMQSNSGDKEIEDGQRKSPTVCADLNKETDKEKSEVPEDKLEHETKDSNNLKTGEVFNCPYCSYSSDKLSSLNRHKRIHCRGSNSPTSSTSSLSPASKQESYCAECNIQFSSFSTFKCHKEFYCSKRVDNVGIGLSPADKHPPMPNGKEFPSISFHEQMSPTSAKNLKHFMTASPSSLISGQTNVILAPPIIARGMLNIPFGMPTVIVQPVVPPSPSSISPGTIPCNKVKQIVEISTDQPLDLSLNKKLLPTDDSDKENNISPRNNSTENKRKHLASKSNSPNVSSQSNSPKQRIRPASVNSEEKTPSPVTTTANRISPFITVPPVQFIGGKPIPPVPQSVSKCVDCNIVFYKHENFIIHKKHYCSSRQTRSESGENIDDESKDSIDMPIPVSNEESTLGQTTPQLSPTDIRLNSDKSDQPTAVDETNSKELNGERVKQCSPPDNVRKSEIANNIICKHCNIRFSSTSTLSAHKEFYCPFVQDIEKHSSENGQHEKQTTEKFSKEDERVAKCDRCGTTFPSLKIMRLHFCTGMATHVPLLRCPYCDYVTQTENRISEHLKVHMPSKAYRCTICGYRGNTVRGMRMHGKMHIDNGEEFSDEQMIEIEEPPLVPVIFNNPSDAASTNVEAELIRLKNEPYKRRRSRKSYEKSEHMGNIRESATKSICVYCGQSFNDNTALAMHMRIHEMVAFHAASSRNLKCHFCDHVAETFPSLMVHVEHKHLKDVSVNNSDSQDKMPPNNTKSPKRSISDSDSDQVSSPKRCRYESESPDETRTLSPRCSKKQNERRLHDAEKARTLDLLNLGGNIKSEPTDTSFEEDLEVENERTKNDLKRKQKLEITKLHSQNECLSDKKIPNIKSDVSNDSEEPVSLVKPTVVNPELARYYQLAMKVMPPLIVPTVPNRLIPSPSGRQEKLPSSAKYCKYCDISFTYLSTYIAHKKYYCTTRQPEEMTSPAKA